MRLEIEHSPIGMLILLLGLFFLGQCRLEKMKKMKMDVDVVGEFATNFQKLLEEMFGRCGES